MRKNDLWLANFILRYGVNEVLLDYVEEILIPAFTDNTLIRRYGDTEFQFFDVKLSRLGEENGVPILALHGHFVKDTILKRTQIFRRGAGLIDDEAEIESAPSAFFMLILNNHRLLYFAETPSAPDIGSFATTAQHFLTQKHQTYVREQRDDKNLTRSGPERLTIKEMFRRFPAPNLTVIPIAGEGEISEIIKRFRKVQQIRFKLAEPNDEHDASEAIAAVEEAMRPMRPKRLEILVSDAAGLEPEAAAKAIIDASEGQNTEVEVDGLDTEGLRLKVENDEFALRVPVDSPPGEDKKLAAYLMNLYRNLAASGKVRGIVTPAHVVEKLKSLIRMS